MPVNITELDNGLGNLIKGEGFVTGKEFFDTLSEHVSKPEEQLKKYIYSISDYTEITGTDLALEYLYKSTLIMNNFSKINPDIIIVIAASDHIAYNLAKLWSLAANTTGWHVMVFRKRTDLDYWLEDRLNKKDSSVLFEFDKNL